MRSSPGTGGSFARPCAAIRSGASRRALRSGPARQPEQEPALNPEPTLPLDAQIAAREEELYLRSLDTVARRTCHLFAVLLPVQWLMAVALALCVTPLAWAGPSTRLHPHVWAALVLGGLIVALPVWLALARPTRQFTRHAIACAQMFLGMLLIHVTDGRIETHFHIFGSLAFLSFFRDWRPLLTGTAVVTADHLIRGYYWPASVYGTAAGAEWRWVEHAAWVAFEDVCLIVAIRWSTRDMRAGAEREARLERANEGIELAVRQRTAELSASELRFRTLIDQASDAVFVVDTAGRIVDANQQACDSLGYTRAELTALTVADIDAECDRHGPEAVVPALASGQARTLYGHQKRKDGARFPVEVRARVVEMNGQRFILSLVRDITDRQRSEEALRASEERYRLLFDSNPHPMWVFESDRFRFLAVNDAAVRHYGFQRDRFLQMTIADLEAAPPPAPAACAPAPGNDGQLRTHFRACGTVRQMELAAHPIDFDGRAAVLVLAVDVTERLILEEQLKQSQKLESIGQLAAGIAHEINTPIQYIGDNTTFIGDTIRDLSAVLTEFRAAGNDPGALQAAAQAAEAADLDYLLEEAPRALQQTQDGVKHVARIVKAMKEFAHPGASEKVPVDLNQALKTVVTVARSEWKYVAEVITRLDPALPTIRGLPGELNQVFLNLLVNAAHAIRSSGPAGDHKGAITITTRSRGASVEVLVADTGCGIPTDIRDRVFDPFFTTKPVGQGTGQGLAIAHTVIVNQHGGAITFESQPGFGTVFIVHLPVDGLPLTRSGRISCASAVRAVTDSGVR